MKLITLGAWGGALGGAVTMASAATAGTISITLPRLSVSDYKRPYVAGWIEPAGGGAARSLFAWYDIKKGGNEPGVKWLSDLRTWWRKSGRTLKLPADGVSGATRGAGTYKVAIPANIAPGKYVVFVEAAREHGGREIISVPVTLPASTGRAAGKTELGAITIAAN